MDRSATVHGAKIALTVVAAALPFAVVAGLWSAPAIPLERVGPSWVVPAGLALLAAAAAAATILWLARGMGKIGRAHV